MIDQLFETFRKASESSLQAQREMFSQWVQQWQSAALSAAGISNDWNDLQKRLQASTSEMLNRHRALLDSTYRAGIEMIEQAFRVSEARSPDDYRRMVEDLWRKTSDTVKTQSEALFRDFQNTTEKWTEQARSAQAPS